MFIHKQHGKAYQTGTAANCSRSGSKLLWCGACLCSMPVWDVSALERFEEHFEEDGRTRVLLRFWILLAVSTVFNCIGCRSNTTHKDVGKTISSWTRTSDFSPSLTICMDIGRTHIIYIILYTPVQGICTNSEGRGTNHQKGRMSKRSCFTVLDLENLEALEALKLVG